MSSFFTEIVGLRLVHMMPNGQFAELADSSDFRIQIKKVSDLGQLHYGYSPILSFEINVNEDLDKLVEKACNPKNSDYRCHLDGQIIQDEYVKLACLKLEEGTGTGGGGPTLSLTQKLKDFPAEQ